MELLIYVALLAMIVTGSVFSAYSILISKETSSYAEQIITEQL